MTFTPSEEKPSMPHDTAADSPRAAPLRFSRAPSDVEINQERARELLADLPASATTDQRLAAAQVHATLAVSYRMAGLTQVTEDGTAQLIYLRRAVEHIGVIGAALIGAAS